MVLTISGRKVSHLKCSLVPLIDPNHLLRNTRAAGRPKDLVDARRPERLIGKPPG